MHPYFPQCCRRLIITELPRHILHKFLNDAATNAHHVPEYDRILYRFNMHRTGSKSQAATLYLETKESSLQFRSRENVGILQGTVDPEVTSTSITTLPWEIPLHCCLLFAEMAIETIQCEGLTPPIVSRLTWLSGY